MPGAPIGMNEKIVTIPGALKNQGYATGQFGKNHLGDLNRMLPTNHGFDEFLYDYFPENDFRNYRKNFGPRGVTRS